MAYAAKKPLHVKDPDGKRKHGTGVRAGHCLPHKGKQLAGRQLATIIQEARTKLVAWSELEVTGKGVSSQQFEKIGIGKGLPAVIEKYGGRSSVTSDSCVSLLKQVKGIVQELLKKKGEREQLRDIWHQQKRIFTKWGN